MIIGIHGFAQSGKDTLGQAFVDDYGFTKVGFADKIRQAVYLLNPILSHNPLGETTRVQDVVDEHGWEWSKKQYKEVRRLLQVFGTDVGRGMLYDGVWIDNLIKELDQKKDYVITDVRFENEVNKILEAGGFVVKINRPGVGPVNSHSSDQGLPDEMFDIIIENDSTVYDLQAEARFIHATAYTKNAGFVI